jgi:hypothetical protein
VFVLEDEDDLIDTIRSRSVSMRYTALSTPSVVEYLSNLSDDKDQVALCANLSGGSIGRAVEYLRGGRLDDRDRVLDLLSSLKRKPYHQVMGMVDTEENLDSLIYLLRRMLVDMALLEAGMADRVANFDRVDQLQKARSVLGSKAIRVGLASLNKLYADWVRIKRTHRHHLNSALLQVKKAI